MSNPPIQFTLHVPKRARPKNQASTLIRSMSLPKLPRVGDLIHLDPDKSLAFHVASRAWTTDVGQPLARLKLATPSLWGNPGECSAVLEALQEHGWEWKEEKVVDGRMATNPETLNNHIEHTHGYSVYPQGLTDLSDINAPSFAVQVNWRGEHQGRSGGGWSVSRGSAELLVSSVATGQKWNYPERFRRWQYRFPTFEEALAAARAVVDGVKVNGRTWEQWQAIVATQNTSYVRP